ncbi:MAG: WHG domain-containing protein [Anaerolineae bacterium]|nr:WHG domain-containing protein [Anaerolineae bacterium]
MPPKKHIDRQRVLDVAIALADEVGFEQVTLAAVADRLGIRIPSLYNHIAGLPGLRHAMRLWGLQQLHEAMRNAAIGKAGDEAILDVAQAYRDFARVHPGIYAATLRAAGPDEPELAAVGEHILDVLQTILAPHGFGPDETLHVIRGLRSLLHGFVDLETAGGFGLALDRDESFRRLLNVFVYGIHALKARRLESWRRMKATPRTKKPPSPAR